MYLSVQKMYLKVSNNTFKSIQRNGPPHALLGGENVELVIKFVVNFLFGLSSTLEIPLAPDAVARILKSMS